MSPLVNCIQRALVIIGNTLVVIGCLALVLGVLGVIDPERFAVGLSSGLRVIGSVAVAGCLLSAIGYGILDFQKQ